jgi:hypothetical protein
MNAWLHAGLGCFDDRAHIFQSLVFYYLQMKKFIPSISTFFNKDKILPVESYDYGVLLSDSDCITYQSTVQNSTLY